MIFGGFFSLSKLQVVIGGSLKVRMAMSWTSLLLHNGAVWSDFNKHESLAWGPSDSLTKIDSIIKLFMGQSHIESIHKLWVIH